MVERLLAAGADPTVRDSANGSALDYAYGEVLFEVISRAMFPNVDTRDRQALAWLNEYDGWKGNAWESTPLSRAIAGVGGLLPPPPPPPPDQPGKGMQPVRIYRAEGEDRVLERVRTLIRIGADPNGRARRARADWTPLGMAMHNGELRVARFLLQQGAQTDQRWCVGFVYGAFNAQYGPAGFKRDASCNEANGMTTLMESATTGDREKVDLLLEFNADKSLKDCRAHGTRLRQDS